MNKCKECKIEIPSQRAHLGYSECVDCSTVKKYVSHTIYPHKTGAWVQPVSEEQSENLNRLDRRGTGGTRKAKGIVADKSWDRFLETYTNSKNTSEPKPKRVQRPATQIFIPYKEAIKKVFDTFNSRGYTFASNYTQSLYASDKISLTQKSKIINELAFFETLTSKEKKYFKKLQKKT
jgi:hypothetical protein|tara:strand:- start:21 stop:554 length:534 start_codon:yes stop_codon:yes gene_type:complete